MQPPKQKAMILKKEVYLIIGLCMEIHNILGPGLKEIVYKDALEIELKMNKITFHREKPYIVNYKGHILPHKFDADFVVFDDLILEIKAVSDICEDHITQTLNYISIAQSELGLVINFGARSLQHRRVINSEI